MRSRWGIGGFTRIGIVLKWTRNFGQSARKRKAAYLKEGEGWRRRQGGECQLLYCDWTNGELTKNSLAREGGRGAEKGRQALEREAEGTLTQ